MAGLSRAGFGSAWQGSARHGRVRRGAIIKANRLDDGLLWFGAFRLGAVGPGGARFGEEFESA
jgi:hypothetical protein